MAKPQRDRKSVTSATWEIPPKGDLPVLLQLQRARGITNKELPAFLNPRFPDSLNPPQRLPQIRKASGRILQAVAERQQIAIFGDYDADGTCAAVALYDVLKTLGSTEPLVKIPDRAQGYGLSPAAVEDFASQKVKLLLTVDTGIGARREIALARRRGMDVVVFDHHEPPPTLPPATALVNPKLPNSRYGFRELCATGIVVQWAHYLLQNGHLGEAAFKWLLDLGAIATIADMVPLVGDNRVLARWGLVVLAKTRRPGLQALYREAGIRPEAVNAYAVGYGIAPRLNAAGRLGEANIGLELLRATPALASELARTLERLNQKRQALLEEILAEAEREIAERGLDRHKAIVLKSKRWPRGVIGLVAGRILEGYQRPVVILEERDGILTGSARAPAAFHLMEGLGSVSAHLESYGGHARAAGLSLQNTAFAAFEKAFLTRANAILKDEDLVSRFVADARLSTDELTSTLWKELKRWEPFGYGNPKPLFYLEAVPLRHPRRFGKQSQHLSWLYRGVRIVAFNRAAELLQNDALILDLLVTLEFSRYNGEDRLEAFVRSWR